MRLARPSLAPAAIVFALALPALAQGPFEGPLTFKASEILPPAFQKGAHFQVAPEVPTPGFFHEFTLNSDYGKFEAEGNAILLVRLREVEALGALDDVSKTAVFVKAAGTSVVNVGKGVASVAKDPEGTAKGIGGGLKRFGQNLGRSAKSAGESASDAVSGGDKQPSNEPQKSTGEKAADAGGGAANSVLGVNSAMRRWAQKVGADPYTTNEALRKALMDVAKVDAAGGIAAKVVVPVPMVVGYTASVGNLVWGKDPQALLKMNEERLAALGVDKKVAGALSKSKVFTLTYQTFLIDALFAVKAKGSASYVDTAREADTEREAVFFVESAQMLKGLNAASPVLEVLPDSRAMVAKTKDGRAVVLVPVDWIRWTESFEKQATEVGERAKKELGAARLQLRMTGRMSKLARERLQARGWTVEEGVKVASLVSAAPATKK